VSNNYQADERYWAEYDGLQHAKHQLLRNYLGGWFPILSSWNGRVLFIDCHAGRGRHKTGHEGSPILALKVLLEHRSRKRILTNTEVCFVFIEVNESNYSQLCDEISALGKLPTGVVVAPFQDDYESFLQQLLNKLKQGGRRLAPAFAFIDPYGFMIPMNVINELLEFSNCEIFINFMFRYVDMAMRNEAQAANMDFLFGNKDWRYLVGLDDYISRADAIISFYSDQLKANFVTHMNMRGGNNALKYVLFHATNHERGRELMKEAMWRVTPDGSFTAYERNRPDQLVLIQPEPDLSLLEDKIWEEFMGKSVRMEELYDWLLEELYLKSHLHTIIRRYRNNGVIRATDYGTRFAFRNNPLITFPKEKPQ
jgi:three-Cys-motif partner protein